MRAYYNEHDPQTAAWLRELIRTGEIAPGDVDERSISDVAPDELRGYTQCHFFAGIGGWSLALRIAGWPDHRPVWTGSCPCQPFSTAGRRAGTGDERHLWPQFARLIRQCRPIVVFGEQVASKASLEWLDVVHADLENEDYAVGAADLCAAGVGAPHIRQRLFWVGHTERAGREGWHFRQDESALLSLPTGGGLGDPGSQRRNRVGLQLLGRGLATGGAEAAGDGTGGGVADGTRLGRHEGQRAVEERARPGDDGGTGGVAYPDRLERRRQPGRERADERAPWSRGVEWRWCRDEVWRPVEPGIQPLVDGLPRGVVPGSRRGVAFDPNDTAEARVMRLRGYGNAIVPQVAAEFVAAFVDLTQSDDGAVSAS